MVRGRRVRAVVEFSRNDDCCSPNPKRKDQRAEITTKMTQNMLNTNKSITHFFQSVGVDIDYNDTVKELDDIKSLTRIIGDEDLICREVKEYIDLNTTPQLTEIGHRDVKLTPHRIELRSDSENSLGQNGATENCGEKKPPAKVKRRLKNGQINHDNNEKGVEKLNHKLTEYFPVRRSVRKTKTTVLEEKQKFLEDSLRNQIEEGLSVRQFEGKGRGVVASKAFFKGDFVVEYSGELIDINQARIREKNYAQDQNMGCYMYYFKHKNQQYCIDATAETGRLGRLVNHSRNGNLVTRTVSVDGIPRLVLIAKDDIGVGEEITYDYGDRSRESLKHHPWLAF